MSSPRVVLLKSLLGKKGGLEKYTFRILEGFLKRGCEVTVLSSNSPPSPLPVQTIVFQGPKWPGFFRMEAFDRSVLEWLKKHPSEIVLGLDRNRFQTHLRAGNGVHAAYLEKRFEVEGFFKKWRCKINPLHRKILEIEKEGFENPHLKKLFTNSHMVKEEIIRFYKTDPSKIEVIHNGVEWKEMGGAFSNWEEDKRKIAHIHNLNPDHFHFLFIGNGYLRKGLGPLLFALRELTERNFFLSVIGKEKNTEKYRALIQKLNLEENVRIFGPQEKMLPFYQLADCLVIPSWYDPFANVTVEALAMGLIVLSSKTNGGSEVLNSSNGYILPNLDDKNAFVEALKAVMKKRKDSASALKIRKSVEHLDFSRQITQFLDACLL